MLSREITSTDLKNRNQIQMLSGLKHDLQNFAKTNTEGSDGMHGKKLRLRHSRQKGALAWMGKMLEYIQVCRSTNRYKFYYREYNPILCTG